MKYAEIIIDISHEKVDRTFSYCIPEEICGQVEIGSNVKIPFGQYDSIRTGYVVDLSDSPSVTGVRLKSILGLVEGAFPAEKNLIKLAWWMKEYYGGTMSQALKTVMPVKKNVRVKSREKLTEDLPQAERPVLNPAQRAVTDAYEQDLLLGKRAEKPYLIHGVTGSGKTEIYMDLIEKTLARGEQVIVLVPEIALTFQTYSRFASRFPGKLCLMHSRLSAGEKYESFRRASAGEASIMLGARSALFAPFQRLGLIVVDEEHEDSYNSEVTPRYHAVETARELARIWGAGLVLGSATPSMESYKRARDGSYRLFVLPERAAAGSRKALVKILDMRQEMKAGNRSMFGRELKAAMEDRLGRGEQIMLFLNRRGYSSFVSCRECGRAIKCPHCDVAMALHGKTRLLCHYCGYSVALPKTCPSCGSEYMAGFGIGTQQVEEAVSRLFPGARILRMDQDTTGKKGSHERILKAFAGHNADILIGTQMIVKGHDFPNVTLVGILAADISLYAPDYRCSERTFQLLVQAAGRAGRAEKPGLAVIQTYIPEHYSIRTAAMQDYEGFYDQEAAFRSMVFYPPFCRMLSVSVSGSDEELLCAMMDRVAESVRKNFSAHVMMIGPARAPVYKVNDVYTKLLYLKQENYDILQRIQRYIDSRWNETKECGQLKIQYEFE